MIRTRFSGAGIILAGALLLVAVHESECCSRSKQHLEFISKESDKTRAALKKNEECMSLKYKGGDPYARCLREALEMLKDLAATGEMNWIQCETAEKEPAMVQCELHKNSYVVVSADDFLEYISSDKAP